MAGGGSAVTTLSGIIPSSVMLLPCSVGLQRWPSWSTRSKQQQKQPSASWSAPPVCALPQQCAPPPPLPALAGVARVADRIKAAAKQAQCFLVSPSYTAVYSAPAVGSSPSALCSCRCGLRGRQDQSGASSAVCSSSGPLALALPQLFNLLVRSCMLDTSG